MDRSTSCLVVATILAGVALAVLLFRAWRGLRIAETEYLMVAPIVLSVLLVVLPLLAIPQPGKGMLTISLGSCATSAALMAAYPFAIFDSTRRIASESALFLAAGAVAGLAALAIFRYC